MSAPRHSRSDLWHRAAKARPRLRPDTRFERHIVRGQVWYLVRDRMGHHSYRFTPAVYAVIVRMTGTRSLDEIWREIGTLFGEEAPAQDQILSVMGQLHAADLLLSDRPVDEDEAVKRASQDRTRQRASRYQNPLYLRLKLFDPDRILTATSPMLRPIFSPLGLALWALAVLWLAVEATLNFGALSADVQDRLLAGNNLLLLACLYPLVKILHELGHAYAVKRFGHEVHEIGVMLLTFMPSPYVDASESALIASRWQRALVGAAGMMVELVLAAIAMAVWLSAQPGLVRALAFDILLVAGVSTLVVNGNPLLRFDGYYILSDLIEMPNLAARSTRYWSYLVQRYLLRAPQATTSETTPGEKGWLLFYAPASFAYRLVVVIGIAMLIGSQYFFIGVLLGCWLFAASVVLPVVKILRFGFVAPELAPVRMRTISLIGTGFALIALLLFALPLPERTLARGVVWVPEDTRIVAGVSGFIETVLKPGGSEVTAGDPLLRLEDHTLNVKRQIQEARISELRARLAGAEANSPADLVLMRRELAIALDELSTLRKREDALVIRSPQSGRVYYQHEADLPRLFARSGDLIGHVVTQASGIVRAAIPEHEIDRVRSATGHVAIILDSNPDVVLKDAQLVRQMPEATHVLPSLALSATNGGPFTLDPSAKQEGSVIESLFIVDVQLPVSEPIERWGERATVRFDHGASALAPRLYRLFRQVFLERFHV